MAHKYFAEESYEWLFKYESSNFWYRVRDKIVVNWVNYYLRPDSTFLELGCGTGFISRSLKNFHRVDCSDISEKALEYCRLKDAADNYYQVDLYKDNFPAKFHGRSYDGLGLFDVIEHIGDDGLIIKKLHSLLSPQSFIFITVPANQDLWSDWDEFTQHKRRYSKQQLVSLLQDNGYSIERISYFMCILYPLLKFTRSSFFMRIMKLWHYQNNIHQTIHENLDRNPILNEILYGIFSIEVHLLKLFNLPFGSSIICVAKKRDPG